MTFSDALASVRRWLWSKTVLPSAGHAAGLEKLPADVRELLSATPAPAA